MKTLYIASYFDGDVDNWFLFVSDDTENREKVFSNIYRDEYGADIDPADIQGIYPVKTVRDEQGKEQNILIAE
jgi:hypothetical protein